MAGYNKKSLKILSCLFLLDPSGQNVDLQEIDELLQTKYRLTVEEADEYFAIAMEDGVVELGPDRKTS
jgi:hypothetical protein